MRRLWPRSLAGQLVLLALVALVAAQALSLMIFADERQVAVRAAYREQVLARTAGLVRLLAETPPGLHARMLRASSGALVRFTEDRASAVTPRGEWQRRNPIARQLDSLLDGNGIPYAVQHEHVGALYPGVALLGSRVMVESRDRQRAEILLSRLALQVREATGEAG